tara:strand:- start:928 stop:1536 length:609 start_codon:yes stop_codon:yes gene_type:complete
MKITKRQLINIAHKTLNESTDRSYSMEHKSSPIPLQSLADPEFARLVKSSINEHEARSGDHTADHPGIGKMNITKSRLRTIINEELEIISERWIPLSSFPERGIPNYNSNSGDPNDGLVALNTKFNSLMTIVMVLNDNLTSRADVREIIDEEIEAFLGSNQEEEDRASIANPQEVEEPKPIPSAGPTLQDLYDRATGATKEQ